MGFFDKLKNESSSSAPENKSGNKSETIVFADMPENIEAFKALSQASLTSPFDTAALAVVAFCLYPLNKELCFQAVDFLRGPAPMNGIDKQFITDRFRDKDYVPRSYFAGATPNNDYMPSEPYSITVNTNIYSYDTENCAKLFIASGGADSPRPLTLRLAKDGKWYLWEYSSVLLGIRQPESSNPWV